MLFGKLPCSLYTAGVTLPIKYPCHNLGIGMKNLTLLVLVSQFTLPHNVVLIWKGLLVKPVLQNCLCTLGIPCLHSR